VTISGASAPLGAGALRGSLSIAASIRERVLGVLLIAAAIVYLIPFVPRGWIPSDEGMLGQSAERVLHGGLPHVDYEEMYTGGLSWMYAAVFKATSIDLVNLRWALFAGAAVAVWLIYAITRRYLRPMGAALATWLALLWSFPNYFAGLPSWWLLICALLCLWTFIRYIETQQWRYVIAAGLAAGVAIAIKQTGVYLFLALMLSLLYGDRRTHATIWTTSVERMVRWGSALAAVIFAGVILAPRMLGAEGLYLFAPVVACAIAFVVCTERSSASPSAHSTLVLASLAAVAAALPIAWLVMPYVTHHHLWEFVHGVVLLPRKRLAFASLPMREVVAAVAMSVPLLVLVFLEVRTREAQRSVVLRLVSWTAAIVLPILALWNLVSYQLVWQFARTIAALLPIAIAWQVASGRVQDPRKRAMLFMLAAMLAWISLNQFPYAGPVYFLYTTPLAVIAAIAAADAQRIVRRETILPWAVLLLMFALVSANRGYIGGLLGMPPAVPEEVFAWSHLPSRLNAPLDLPRAHLDVGGEDASVYQRLVSSIGEHLRGGQLMAAPDCPEVYFLAGLPNRSGRLYDIFSSNASVDAAPWLRAEVVVVNHKPLFAKAPSQAVMTAVRREFSLGERLGPFEIRWR
jgi:Dolichyl-phosphate-mannose-protein mannosyltransferase